MSPAQALQTAFLPAARMLNYGWEARSGASKKANSPTSVAVSGNPLEDVAEMERVRS